MRRSPVGVLVALLLVLASAATGCSTVPTSSPTVQVTQAPQPPDDEVGIEPLSPVRGATPEEVVRGFIDAAASTVRGHPVAREHLAPEAADSWSDEAGITVLTPGYATVTTDSGAVAVTADAVGTVDQRGVFTGGGPEVFTYEFDVEQVDDEWRITRPPDGLLILQPDFERVYDQLSVYFLDPTGRRLVPDPRYLITGEAQPTALVDRLLAGPSSELAAGVGNPLASVQLRRAVRVSARAVTVDLTGVPDGPGPLLSELCAQLVWTLDQLRVGSVEILVDGEPVALEGVPSVQNVGDWASFDPDAVAVDAIGHYVDAGALRTVTGEPAPGPAGTGVYGLTGAAVSADMRTGKLDSMVATAGNGPVTLLAGDYGGELAPVLTGATLTAPTVAATRAETWVVREGVSVVRVPAGGPAQAVAAPTLAGLGRTEVLQLSPDGVRAAVVVDGPDGPALYRGTVVRSEDGGVALRDLRAVAPSLSQVVDVAWRDGGTLLVLAGDGAEDRIVPYTVGVDGWGLTVVPTSGLPTQPRAIAAAPGRQPLVSAGGTIWRLSGSIWVTLLSGREPLSGTEPFYPL